MPSRPTCQTPSHSRCARRGAATTGTADDSLTLDKAIDGIAKNVVGLAKERNAKEIVVNPITDTGDLTHTSGSGLTEKLISRLRRREWSP